MYINTLSKSDQKVLRDVQTIYEYLKAQGMIKSDKKASEESDALKDRAKKIISNGHKVLVYTMCKLPEDEWLAYKLEDQDIQEMVEFVTESLENYDYESEGEQELDDLLFPTSKLHDHHNQTGSK